MLRVALSLLLVWFGLNVLLAIVIGVLELFGKKDATPGKAAKNDESGASIPMPTMQQGS